MAAPITALTIDGVLRSYVGDGVISAGQALYHGLAEVGQVAIISDGDSGRDMHWLKVNGFTKHAYFIEPGPYAPEDPGARRLAQIRQLRTYQPHFGVLVESNPAIAAECVLRGVPVLLLAHPRYTKPEFRPDYKAEIVPWSALTAEIERQEELRASDNRLGSTL